MNLFEYLFIIILNFTNVFESGMINDVGLYLLAVIICFFTCSTLICIKYKREILNKIMKEDD